MPALRNAICLNGWWDFLPVEGVPGNTAPESGWLEGAYLAPSWWKRPAIVRLPGERYFSEINKLYDDARPLKDYEFLCDAFGYPPEWSRAQAAWFRRHFEVKAAAPGRRHVLRFDAVAPRSRLYVNGALATCHTDAFLPLEVDVTAQLKAGVNEVAILACDWERDERGRTLTPSGNLSICDSRGIWQDVWLLERGEVHVADVTVRTLVREKRLELRYELANDSPRPRRLTLSASVSRWAKGLDPLAAAAELTISAVAVDVPAQGTAAATLSAAWPDAPLWSPATPVLHNLVTTLREDGRTLDIQVERFGFREIWIDGPNLLLNGHPVHLFSDWGHKSTPYCHTEAWIRQWFGMLRDGNFNHSRLHAFPHPPLVLDLADEEGVLITGETGLFGSSALQAVDCRDYWRAAEAHVRRFVQRDKNHPCIILWSVENEMRFGANQTPLTINNLPRLRRLFNELDPTRPAYHEGDSSMWDEGTQPVVSRHYMKCCSGYGWWDRSRPLIAGEMSLYHLIGPNNTSHLGGDAVWASFKAMDEAAARDSALIVETGRSLGVAGFGPWNLSCRDNLRMEAEAVRLDYCNWAAPGIKPLLVAPHSSEFAFWKPGKGYTPGHAFAIQARSFRALALIDRSLRSACFAGTKLVRELFVANDTGAEVSGMVEARLLGPDGTVAAQARAPLSVGSGQVASCNLSLPIPGNAAGVFTYEAKFAGDAWSRPFKIVKRAGREFGAGLAFRVALFAGGDFAKVLERLGVDFVPVGDLEPATLAGFPLLVVGRNALKAGMPAPRRLRDFAQGGGRVLLLEQEVSPFAGLPLVDNPLQTQFVRAPHHPALMGLVDSDFAFWGDAPYPAQGGDNYVVERPYAKDDARHSLFLLDGDEGGFGTGGMGHSSLVELREGAGCLLACQLVLSDKLDTQPGAELLLLNMLRHLASFAPAVMPPFEAIAGTALDAKALAAKVKEGTTVLVEGASLASLAALSEAFGVALCPMEMADEYQAVRVHTDPLLDGVSNEDCCGVNSFTYGGADKRNFRIGRLYLAPSAGLEPLLETATESCLKELLVLNQRLSPLYVNALSRFLYAEKPSAAVVLGSVRLGAGRLLINQFVPEGLTDCPRLARLGNRLRANLGQTFEGGPLDATEVAAPAGGGKGYPERLAVLNLAVSGELRQRLIDSTRHSEDLFLGQPILSEASWEGADCPDGEISAAGLDLSNDIYLFFGLQSPRSRRGQRNNLGCPNPEILSFLDLEGEGAVELVVDGMAKSMVELVGGRGMVADIELDKGANHVLLRWKPQTKDARLKLRWRDIQGHLECGFVFFVGR